MSSSFFRSTCIVSIISFLILFFISAFFIPFIPGIENIDLNSISSSNISFGIDTTGFAWPTPGYKTITSEFGYRRAPTSGASTYHSGIDIAAPTGSNIIATFSGVVSYTGFYGAGGFTVIVKNDNLSAEYCHVSPQFIVRVGQTVKKGQIIAKVGPKNVYGVSNNPYRDSNGNPTNGATTGPHLHFSIKKDGKAVNPFNYF